MNDPFIRYDNTFAENRVQNVHPFRAGFVAGFFVRHLCRNICPDLSNEVSLEWEDVYGLKVNPKLFSALSHDTRISNGAFRVWHILYGMLGKNIYCWPSIRGLAETLNASPQSISLWIKELKECGYISAERGNKQQSNRYYVAAQIPEKGVSNSDTRVSKTVGGGVLKTGTELNSGNLSQEKNSPPSVSELIKAMREAAK